MFSYCTDPDTLDTVRWFSCFLTNGVHLSFYMSFIKVLVLLLVTAPVALAVGFAGAMATRATLPPLRWLGEGYIAIMRGVPDIAFFLFFVIALDQAFEWTRHQVLCPDWTDPIRQGNDFLVCPDAKMPLGRAAEWVHQTYSFFLAVITFAIVFGAFAAYGMSRRQTFWRILVPQMWIYALPGLSNLWLILIKATPLLFLLGIEDIVYWAREIGGTKTSQFTDYPHGDWRMWYFLFLLVFYLSFTRISEILLERLTVRLSHGQATTGGEALRKEATA